jgi:riboflavin synthase
VVAVFTGIVRELGTVTALDRDPDGARIRISADLTSELAHGDSVSVAGACLTVAARADGAFEADAMNQTLGLTTLGELKLGDSVNLEPALRAGDPLGGHFVQGHVDGIGTVTAVSQDGISRRLRIALPADIERYVVPRGSIAIDGVSLTLADAGENGVEVALIPETLELTTLGGLAEGDRVNVEVDLVARHIERLMQGLDSNEGKRNA